MASRNLITFITTILLVITPAFGGTLYAASADCILYSIDTETAIVTEIGEYNNVPCQELEYDCVNEIMYLGIGGGAATLAEINISNADIGSITEYVSGDDFPALEFVDGTLYGWARSNGGLIDGGLRIIDPTNGDDSTVINEMGMILFGGLAYDICANIMYGITSGCCSKSWLVSIDLDTGKPTFIGPTNVSTMKGLTFGNGVLYGTTSGHFSGTTPGNLYTIDIETGAATLFQTVIETGEKRIGALSYVSDDGFCESCPTTQPPTQAPTKITNNPTPTPTNDSPDCDCDCENGSSGSDDDESDDAF